MDTFNLLEKYLEELTSHKVDLLNYNINGSIIKMLYSYNPNYEWDVKFIIYDNDIEVQLLDYLTWIYNQCLKIKN